MHRTTNAVGKFFSALVYLLGAILVLLWALPRFDVFIFSWGTSLLPRNADVRLLRWFGKQVIAVLGHGSEARPPYMSTRDGRHPLDARGVRELHRETAQIARRVRRLGRSATRVIGLPTTAQFFEVPFVNFYELGLPTTADPSLGLARPPLSPHIGVLHVPSNPRVKGSEQIREVMERVCARHPHVQYQEINGRPHDEILEALQTCSFVVDQLWSDIPMAVVGTEAATLGTPTVISGYAWDYWKSALSADQTPPTYLTTPELLESQIEALIANPAGVTATGLAARAFVEEHWSPAAVAARYLRLISGDVPADWIIDPRQIVYAWGVGIAKEHVLDNVRQLVDAYGVESLRWPGASAAYGLD